MNEATIKKPNKLINEKSPYLLQHAYNPVNWYPWQEEAFNRAQKENKPIFLSIGYSTCHWCHVMEHESFEDNEVAELMNKNFVSIKVDREERPDIDSIYMSVCQMLTGSGGWPLTIVMTPDKKPFFAGTYFPKKSSFGRVGMVDLIPRVSEVWTRKNKEVIDQAEEITKLLHKVSNEPAGREINESIVKIACDFLIQRFDKKFGGFGGAPKFPTPHNLIFLLRQWKKTKNKEYLEAVEKTLQSMRLGGIYDHIGFGFHRYSTDDRWLVPHFEKMLYDQAMLAIAYIETFQATGKEEYGNVACEIFTYVLRDMTSKEGGFYSALDADSEGEEGRFYVWMQEELSQVLEKNEAELISKIFNVEKAGNYSEEATKHKTGNNILYLESPIPEIASKLKITEHQLKMQIEIARQKLFDVRKKRVYPHLDDKVLTSWNGLMIAALSKGAQVFNKKEYADAAKRSVDFILSNLYKDDKLLHRYRENEAQINAHLDDYAFFIWGLLELYEATFEIKYLHVALSLNEYLLQHFWDKGNGGFYFTSDEDKELIVRQKEVYDGALPSGNSISVLNLLRLGSITGNSSLKEKAIKIGSAFSRNIMHVPAAHTQLLVGIDYALQSNYEVVVVGNLADNETISMLNTIKREFVPNKVLLFKPSGVEEPEISKIAKYTSDYKSINDKPTAYICRNYSCKIPTTDINKVIELLNQ